MEFDPRTNRSEVKGFLKKPMAVVLFCYMHEPTEASARAVDHMPMNTLGELIAAFIAKIKLGNPSPAKTKNRDEQFLRFLGFRMNCDGVFTVSGSRYDKYCQDYREMAHPKETDDDTFYESTFLTDILSVPANRSQISYKHQNYRDYFAAEFLKEYIVKCDIQHINEIFGYSPSRKDVFSRLKS